MEGVRYGELINWQENNGGLRLKGFFNFAGKAEIRDRSSDT